MSAPAPQVRAEVLKIARLLHRDPIEFAYLETVEVEDLCELRDRLTETLFDSHTAVLGRIAAASRVLPVALSASLGENVFGPLLSARLAGLLDAGRAVDIAARLPIPFLADVAAELDPRRASEVIARIPPERIAAVTGLLAERGEWVTMGRFVGHLNDGALAAALDAMDDRSLLEVAFVLEEADRLPRLVDLLSPERRDAVSRMAAEEGRLGPLEEALGG